MPDIPQDSEQTRRSIAGEVWHMCKKCKQIILREDFELNLHVCPTCDYHFNISANERIKQFVDADTFIPAWQELKSVNPLKFRDRKDYGQRLKELHRTYDEAFVAGQAKLDGKDIMVGAFDFAFLGGSMGAVVGEKISRLFLRGVELNQPVIIFSASGGARMQEGLVSLMQMAKTCVALAQLQEKKLPFLSILTNPTTGGVAASFAMLGDVNLAEPHALIGFAGPRVVEQTIRENLPVGFQRSEYLLEHGMIDMICHRSKLRSTAIQLLKFLQRTG